MTIPHKAYVSSDSFSIHALQSEHKNPNKGYTKIMKLLTDETLQLIRQLYQSPSFFDRVLAKHSHPFDLLDKIEKSAEPLAIPNLLSYVIASEEKNALAAAKTIHNLIVRLSASDLFILDEQTRLRNYAYPEIVGWGTIQPEDIAGLEYLQSYQADVLGVSSFHNNGFIREKAVKELGSIWNGKELPFLLIRFNDWVLTVRAAAFAAVSARLKPAYASSFVDHLPLVMQLSNRNRIDQTPMVNSIKKLLQAESSHTALLHGLTSQNSFVRRTCFQIALEANTKDLMEIIELGSKNKDNLIRFRCIKKVETFGENEKVDHLLGKFRSDSYMPIRREALRFIAEKYPQHASEELRKSLLDSHWLIRYEARYQITKINPMDFAVFYRTSLAQENTIYSAICGLEEVGIASDETLIKPYVTHPLAKIRRASIRALAKFNSKAYTDLFMLTLRDPSASVSREAVKALQLNRHLLNPQRLWDHLEKTSQAHVKTNLLSLIAHLPKWEGISYLIKAAASKDKIISTIACQKIKLWQFQYNASFIFPTAPQKANLLMVLDEYGDRLDVDLRRGIEAIIESI